MPILFLNSVANNKSGYVRSAIFSLIESVKLHLDSRRVVNIYPTKGGGASPVSQTINEKIRALGELGGLVVFHAGVYFLNESINITGFSNVFVFIPDGVVITLVNRSTYGHLLGFNDGVVYGGKDDRIISNCGIFGNGILSTPLQLSGDNVIGFERVSQAYCIGIKIPEAGRKAITTQVNDPTGNLSNGDIFICDVEIGETGYSSVSIEQGHKSLVVIDGLIINKSNRDGVYCFGTNNPDTYLSAVSLSNFNIRFCNGYGINSYKIKSSFCVNRGVLNQCKKGGLKIFKFGYFSLRDSAFNFEGSSALILERGEVVEVLNVDFNNLGKSSSAIFARNDKVVVSDTVFKGGLDPTIVSDKPYSVKYCQFKNSNVPMWSGVKPFFVSTFHDANFIDVDY